MSTEAELALDRELEALQKESDERMAARRIADKTAAVEQLKLIGKLSKEHGPIGQKFVLVDASNLGEGCIAMKLGSESDFNAFMGSDLGPVPKQAFVEPCVVHPTKDEFRALVSRRPAILSTCANALVELHGSEARIVSGK